MQIIKASKHVSRYNILDRILDDERAETILVDAMANGASLSEYCATLGISKRIHQEYLKKREDYADMFSYAKTLADAWWDKLYRGAMFGKIALDNKLLLAKAGLRDTANEMEQEGPKRLPPIQITFVASRVKKDGSRIDETE